jgi:hypothetical protein
MDNKELVKTALDALERLLRMFTAERYIYLGLAVFSFLLLMFGIVKILTEETVTTAVLVSIFGGSGLVGISSMRVVLFFNKSFKLIEELIRRISHE